MSRILFEVLASYFILVILNAPLSASHERDTVEINQLIRELSIELSNENDGDLDSQSHVILHSSELINYRFGMQKGYLFLGMCSRKAGQHEDAVNYLTKSLSLIKSHEYENRRKTYFELAEVYRLLKNYDLTLSYLKKVNELSDKDITPKQQGLYHLAYSNYLIGINDSNNTMADSAKQHLQIAMDIYQNINDSGLIANCYNSMGNLEHHLEDYSKAIDYYRRAIANYEGAGLVHSLGPPYQNMAAAFWNLDNYDSTLHYYRKAYESGTAQNQLNLRYSASKDLTDVYLELGQNDSALHYIKLNNELEGEIYNASKLRIIREITEKYNFEKAADEHRAQRRNYLLAGLFMALVLGMLAMRFAIILRSRKKIRTEKERSDELLLNILPAKVAKELMSTGKTTPEYFPNSTILFADIENFTRLSESLGANELISLLDDYFQQFDREMKQHGLEKIKTIGDAYLAVSGIPEYVENHARKAVQAALDLQKGVEILNKSRSDAGLPVVKFRIGIHSGPVIAGVVGQQKFQYDIWGDAVNMAARMEETGKPGEVNISSSTYELIRGDDFHFVRRGKIAAKNKGEIEMYFVTSKEYQEKNNANPLTYGNYSKFNKDFTTRLIEGLDKDLTYHGYHHVIDVLEAARLIGTGENLTDNEWDLLNTAILLHDSGFMFGYFDHEERGCVLASEVLPKYGYSDEDILLIHGMIRATKIPQQPYTLMENIIADADLEYLGTDRFDDISETLFKEWISKGLMHERDDWNRTQVKFISAHHYFTDFCKQNREKAKQENLNRIRMLLQD